MTLHSVIVSYKRRVLTQKTLEGYLDTVGVDHSLLIVDNGSPPEVTDWLRTLDVEVSYLPENRYPGYATNRGWESAPRYATLLQRIDNDTLFLPGWCDEMTEAFRDPTLGIYGLTAKGDQRWTDMDAWPVGGNAVIRRECFDSGLRYSEAPWSPGFEECPGFTQAVLEMGYRKAFSTRPAIAYIDDGDFSYRTESHEARGLVATPWRP